MTLSIPHFNSLAEALTSLFGNGIEVIRSRRIAGGDINEAYALTLTDGTQIFMKSNAPENVSFFKTEAAGLTAIADTGAIRTPRILCYGTDPEGTGYSFLLLEFVTAGQMVSDYWEIFAHELAAMHQASTACLVTGGNYGFLCDNYIGSGDQCNTAHDRWIPFFRDCRLEPQFQRAAHYFDSQDQKNIAKLLEHLDDILVEPEYPSLLHGDLWSGNVMTGDNGKAWLIDPAAYVGHAEADLAMTELFGGFSRTFYDAYKEAAPMLPGYDDRRDLYNLYQLLNHLNLFGTAYLSPVKRIVRKYV